MRVWDFQGKVLSLKAVGAKHPFFAADALQHAQTKQGCTLRPEQPIGTLGQMAFVLGVSGVGLLDFKSPFSSPGVFPGDFPTLGVGLFDSPVKSGKTVEEGQECQEDQEVKKVKESSRSRRPCVKRVEKA